MAASRSKKKSGKKKSARAKARKPASGQGRVVRVRGVETPPPSPRKREKLWAPWRLSYIKSSDWAKPAGCVLCNLMREEDGPGNLVLRRTGSAYLVMNRYPYTNGHLMVVPRRHTADFAGLTAEEGQEMNALLQQGVEALQASFRCHGFNIGMNLGRVAGAGIDEHLHFHIVPRWNGDTNFMPVLADVNVVNDHLETAYQTIRQCLAAGKE